MTLGETIRKYRLLAGLTQKELGMRLGFPESSADVRINQYENDKMAPKLDKRIQIAEILGVNIATLNEYHLNSPTEIIKVFFALEDQLGFNIEREEGKTKFIFDDEKLPLELSSYLYLWSQQHNTFIQSPQNASDISVYSKWKGQFPNDIHRYWDSSLDKCYDDYTALIKNYKSHYEYNESKDLLYLFRNLAENGIKVKYDITTRIDEELPELCMDFNLNDFFTDDEKIKSCCTEFFYALYHLNILCVTSESFCYSREDGTHVVFAIFLPALSNFADIGNEINRFYNNIENESEYSKQIFENNFQTNILQNNFDFKSSAKLLLCKIKILESKNNNADKNE